MTTATTARENTAATAAHANPHQVDTMCPPTMTCALPTARVQADFLSLVSKCVIAASHRRRYHSC
jgi:hypothetical protein